MAALDISFCEFISGTLAGFTNTIVGHPLDTVKVRMQISKVSFADVVTSTYHREGVWGFYKGYLFPFLSAGLLNAIYFGVYGNSLRYMHAGSFQTFCCEDYPTGAYLHHWKVAFAGMLGGLASALASCPVECIKTKQQGDVDSRRNAMFVARTIYQQRGIRGLYCGNVPVIYRNSLGLAVYALTYEHALCKLEGKIMPDCLPSIYSEGISGGLAGCAFWIFAMPFDVVKSRIQFDDPNKPKYKGMIDCFKKSFKSEGYYSTFFNGLPIALFRAVPVNAATFIVYQFFLRECRK